jgi:methionyl-tRNA formyltransferase
VRIAFLAADDPLYLPAFFDRVLAVRASETVAVYLTPPLYRRQTRLAAAWRYYRTFGLSATVQLAVRILQAQRRRQSIAEVCRKWGVEYGVAHDVNAPDFLAKLRVQAPDVIVSVSCPQIFRRPLIDLPVLGLINIHGAILPHYRGVMPGFWMLANGERRAGVSIYMVNEDLDAGDLCGQEVFDIRPEETLDEFLTRSKRIAAELLIQVLDRLERRKLDPVPIDVTKGSYYSWPDRAAVARFRASGRQVW